MIPEPDGHDTGAHDVPDFMTGKRSAGIGDEFAQVTDGQGSDRRIPLNDYEPRDIMVLHEPGHGDHVHVGRAGDRRPLAERFDGDEEETLIIDGIVRHGTPAGEIRQRVILPRFAFLCNLSFAAAFPIFRTARHPKPAQNRVSRVKLTNAPANSCFAAILLKIIACTLISGRRSIRDGRKFQTKLYFSVDYSGTVGYFGRIHLNLLAYDSRIHANMVFIRGRFY
jgi:hypothetical protein